MQDVAAEERALSAEEAGRLLADLMGFPEPMPAHQVYRWARTGVLPCVRFGRKVHFTSRKLRAFVDQGGRGIDKAS